MIPQLASEIVIFNELLMNPYYWTPGLKDNWIPLWVSRGRDRCRCIQAIVTTTGSTMSFDSLIRSLYRSEPAISQETGLSDSDYHGKCCFYDVVVHNVFRLCYMISVRIRDSDFKITLCEGKYVGLPSHWFQPWLSVSALISRLVLEIWSAY